MPALSQQDLRSLEKDADGQYPAFYIPKLLQGIENGADLVLGSRFKTPAGYKNELSKKLGNRIFSKVISSLLKTQSTDTTTGFRAFTREVAENIHFINSFTYTQEQLIKAARQGFKIAEIPIQARPTRKSKLFKSPLQYAMRAWINILRIYRDYEPLKFFGISGSLIFTTGFILGLYLVYIQFFAEGVNRHLGLMLLDILVLSIGLQIIVFGFIADMLKK